jgi:transcriptional regulator with XRE-family HTH domain
MGNLNEIVVRNLRALVERDGVSQQLLAQRAGMQQRTVGRILNGEVAPHLSSLDALAGALDVPAWALLMPRLEPARPLGDVPPVTVERMARAIDVLERHLKRNEVKLDSGSKAKILLYLADGDRPPPGEKELARLISLVS